MILLKYLHSIGTLTALILLILPIKALSAQSTTSDRTPAFEYDLTGSKCRLSFGIGTEYRNGYTEYEIQVGAVTVLPEDIRTNAGSRLRFPINSFLGRFGLGLSYGDFSAEATARFQLMHSDEIFKDYDWFEINGGQKSFIYGTATGKDKTLQIDLDLGYSVAASNTRFTPMIRLSWTRMNFDAANVAQTVYYDIIEPDTLSKLDEAVTVSIQALAITYEIDYLAAYMGGSLAYTAPFGMETEMTLLVSPLVRADDLDTHLLRHPPKKAEISSDGYAAIAKIRFGYALKRRAQISLGANYSVFKTSGSQTQTELGEPFGIYPNIPSAIKAEWYSINGGVTLYLGK